MSPDRLRLIVADDEALARGLVRDYVSRCSDVSIVHECVDAATLAAALEQGGSGRGHARHPNAGGRRVRGP